MSKKAIGIEITGRFIKAVELEKVGDRILLLNSIQKEIKDKEELISHLAVLFGERKSYRGMFVSSIPTHLAILRNLRLPFNNIKAINQTIRYEAEPHLPFPIEDVAIDFYVIEKALEDENQIDVLLVGVKKSIISEHLNTLKDFSIEPHRMTLDSFALLNASLLRTDLFEEGAVSIWINIGINYTVMNVMSGTKLISTRGILKGENIFTVNDGGVVKLNIEELDKFKKELEHTLLAIPSIKESPVSKIVLSGEGSLSPGLEGYLANEFNTRCIVFNPLEYIEYKDETIALDPSLMRNREGLSFLGLESGSSWTISIGLALEGIGKGSSEIDILKKSGIVRRGPFNMIKKELISISIALLLIGGLTIFNLYLNLYIKKGKKSSLENQIRKVFLETVPDVTKVPNPIHQMNEKLNEKIKKLEYFNYLEGLTPSPLTVLYELSMKSPRGLKIDIRDMTIGEEDLRISGKADSYESLERLKRGLASSTYFVNIKDEGARKDPNSESVDFNLSIRFK